MITVPVPKQGLNMKPNTKVGGMCCRDGKIQSGKGRGSVNYYY